MTGYETPTGPLSLRGAVLVGPKGFRERHQRRREFLARLRALRANRACPSCGGTGLEPDEKRPCGSCGGEGKVDW